MTFDAIAGYVNHSTQCVHQRNLRISHYSLDPKTIRPEGSMHKDTT